MTKLPVMATGHIERHRNQLHALTTHLSALPQWLRYRTEMLDELPLRLQRAADAVIAARSVQIADMPSRLCRAFDTICSERRRALELDEQYIKMVSPEYILKRGYTLTFKDGKIVKHAGDLITGDEISVKFADGEKKGTIV